MTLTVCVYGMHCHGDACIQKAILVVLTAEAYVNTWSQSLLYIYFFTYMR